MNLCPQKGAGWGGSGRGGACPSPLFYVVRILRVNLTRFRGNLPRTADTDGWDDEILPGYASGATDDGDLF